MRNHLLGALGAIAVLSAPAAADFTSFNGDYSSSANTRAQWFSNQQDEFDDGSLDLNLNSDRGVDLSWQRNRTSEANISNNSGRIEQSARLNTSTSELRFASDISLVSTATGPGGWSSARADERLNIRIGFDQDTTIEVDFVIDFTDAGAENASIRSQIELLGFQERPMLELNDPADSTRLTLTRTLDVMSGHSITLSLDTALSADAHGDDNITQTNNLGTVSVEAVVRIVPAPGALAMLAMPGLLAARRKR